MPVVRRLTRPRASLPVEDRIHSVQGLHRGRGIRECSRVRGVLMSNLPPGVTTGMLPGNDAATGAFETFAEQLTDKLGHPPISDERFESLCDWLWERIEAAYRAGVADAHADHAANEPRGDMP